MKNASSPRQKTPARSLSAGCDVILARRKTLITVLCVSVCHCRHSPPPTPHVYTQLACNNNIAPPLITISHLVATINKLMRANELREVYDLATGKSRAFNLGAIRFSKLLSHRTTPRRPSDGLRAHRALREPASQRATMNRRRPPP